MKGLISALKVLTAAGSLVAASAANAAFSYITYDTWTTNEGVTGNYIFKVTHNTHLNEFNFYLTVDPWNAEALGLFVDLGNYNLPGYIAGQELGANNSAVGLSSISPAGQVAVYDTDTASDDCGQGCNLEGLGLSLPDPDKQWELVFRLGGVGFDNIQTFSWTTKDFGKKLTSFGLVGIRAQQLCSGDDLLPGDINKCDDSDKSYSSFGDITDPDEPPPGVPVPGTLLLLGLGLLGLKLSRRKVV